MLVQLSDVEHADIERETRAMIERAREVHRPHNGLGWGNGRSYELSHFDIEHVSVIAEYAVAKLFGLGLDACDALKRGTGKLDDGTDLTLPDGRTIQIKGARIKPYWRRYAAWWALRDTDDTKFIADFGVLVLVHPNGNAIVAGAVTQTRFKQVKQLVDLGYGPRYAIHSTQMDSIETLLQPTP